MAWQSPGLVAMQQNVAQMTEISSAVGSTTQTGYEIQNAFLVNPSRPLMFTSTVAQTKSVTVSFSKTWNVDSIAVIQPHSNDTVATTGESGAERRLIFRLENHAASAIFDYCGISDAQIDAWGTTNFFRYFSSVPITGFTLRIRDERDSTSSVGAASIGAILIGKRYAFASNPIIPYVRATESTSLFTGRPGGPATMFLRDPALRTINIRTRLPDEDARAELDRLITGRGRLRASGNEAARKRLDTPTALVSPDMWVDTSSPWGGCIFGHFAGGIVSQSYVGAAAMVDLTFQELA